jgi:hypothetical protein
MVFASTQYFASTAEIEGLLHVGTGATSTQFSETDLDYVLPVIQGEIHDFLKAEGLIDTSPITSAQQGYNTIKSVLVKMLMAWNQRRQANKMNNMSEYSANPDDSLNNQLKLQLLGAFVVTDDDSIDNVPLYRGQYHEVL